MNCIFCGKPYKISTEPSITISAPMCFYESNPDICVIHSYLLPRYIGLYYIFFRCKSRSIDTSEYVYDKEIRDLDSLIDLINARAFLKI